MFEKARKLISDVRASTDLAELAGQYTALEPRGTRWVGLCPFHAQREPAFYVNADEGFYYCWDCHESGDAISLVRRAEGLHLSNAVRYLARRSDIAVE